MPKPPDFSSWSCPLPLRDYPSVVMGHGGGGKLSAELIEHLFLPAFRNHALENLGDASIVSGASRAGDRLAFSTDSFVVRPLFFPGGSIGDLAVNGTVNDLAVSGARAMYLSVGMILEEGFALACLARVVDDMARAARTAGVQIVTGDTKVVEKGHGDGCYVNTAGMRASKSAPVAPVGAMPSLSAGPSAITAWPL
jgi:hydrogenase expression/formation protein HypE